MLQNYSEKNKACPAGATRATLFELCRRHDIPYDECDLSEQEIHGAAELTYDPDTRTYVLKTR